MTSWTKAEAAINSAPADKRAITGCLFYFHESWTTILLRHWTHLDVDLRRTAHPAHSESTYPHRIFGLFMVQLLAGFVKVRPISQVLWRYLSNCFATDIWTCPGDETRRESSDTAKEMSGWVQQARYKTVLQSLPTILQYVSWSLTDNFPHHHGQIAW